MNSMTLGVAAAVVMFGAAVVAKDRTQPGLPTQARVVIENRGAAEAVPVVLSGDGRVGILGSVMLDPSAVVGAHAVRQSWDYRTEILPGTDIGALKAAGAEGWEAVGVFGTAPHFSVLLKRPR